MSNVLLLRLYTMPMWNLSSAQRLVVRAARLDSLKRSRKRSLKRKLL